MTDRVSILSFYATLIIEDQRSGATSDKGILATLYSFSATKPFQGPEKAGASSSAEMWPVVRAVEM